ncbi:MAG: DNA primase [Cyclobacteriaceae bacterium]|nr:DNA primase [Cyclobacteriaceae bacterium HetDA_MAG_MS6]
MISPATIDEIKNRMDIVDVVGDFVNLKKSGSSYKALSPFTSEKTPSFYVVPSKGIFKCFSSGKGGDAITFVMEIDGLSYLEAIKYLAGKYGIEIEEEEQTDEALEAQNRRESLYIILNFASEFFQDLLFNHQEGKSIGYTYFVERGFSDDTIKAFHLGYSLNVWDHFYQKAREKGFQEELIEEAGLIIRKEERFYDRFRGRVIFPIHNITGKVIAFGARILTSDKKQPKYINSPETELYQKSKVLYGLFQAKQAIRQADNCFLVEGYTDVISMHQVGVQNVVSSSGTALTEEQVKLIKRYTQNVTVLFDGDAAGIRASLRGIDMLLEGGLNVKAVTLPDGEDPDSYSKSLGTTAFQHFVEEQGQDFIRFKAAMLMDDTQHDPVKKAGVIKEIVNSIVKIGDPVKRAVYIKECSDLLEISETVLIVEQNKLLLERNKDKKTQPKQVQSQDVATELLPIEDEQVESLDIGNIIAVQEKESIRVLINYGKESIQNHEFNDEYLVNYFLNEAEEIQFTHSVYNKILEIIKSKAREGIIVDAKYLLDHGDQEVKDVVVELSANKYEISEFWQSKYKIHVPHETEHLKDVTYTNILRLKFRIIQYMIEQENEKLKNISDQDIDDVLDEINDLKKMEMQIAEILGNVIVK